MESHIHFPPSATLGLFAVHVRVYNMMTRSKIKFPIRTLRKRASSQQPAPQTPLNTTAIFLTS